MIEDLKEKILFVHSEESVGANRLLVDVTTEYLGRRVRRRMFMYKNTWSTDKERGYL